MAQDAKKGLPANPVGAGTWTQTVNKEPGGGGEEDQAQVGDRVPERSHGPGQVVGVTAHLQHVVQKDPVQHERGDAGGESPQPPACGRA